MTYLLKNDCLLTPEGKVTPSSSKSPLSAPVWQAAKLAALLTLACVHTCGSSLRLSTSLHLRRNHLSTRALSVKACGLKAGASGLMTFPVLATLIRPARLTGSNAPLAQLLGRRGLGSQGMRGHAAQSGEHQNLKSSVKEGQHGNGLSSEDPWMLRPCGCTPSEDGVQLAFRFGEIVAAACRRSLRQHCRAYFFEFFRANSRATISFLMASKVTLSAFFQLPPD
jgi:hypothetical protein